MAPPRPPPTEFPRLSTLSSLSSLSKHLTRRLTRRLNRLLKLNLGLAASLSPLGWAAPAGSAPAFPPLRALPHEVPSERPFLPRPLRPEAIALPENVAPPETVTSPESLDHPGEPARDPARDEFLPQLFAPISDPAWLSSFDAPNPSPPSKTQQPAPNLLLPPESLPCPHIADPLLYETLRNPWGLSPVFSGLSPVVHPPSSPLSLPFLGHQDWARGQEAIASDSLAQTQKSVLFHWGIRSAIVADSNPLLAPPSANATAQRTLRVELGPQARIQLGRAESRLQIGANYAGTYTRNVKAPQLPFFQHNATLDGRWLSEKLQLGFRGGFNSQQSGNRDTAARVTEHTLSGRLQAGFRATEKLSTEATIDTTRSDLSGPLLGSQEERLRLFLDYALTPKLQFGGGGGLGMLRQSSSEPQKYTQALLRTKYTPTLKLTLNAAAGLERRRLDTQGNTTSNPVFNLGGIWNASAKAALTLEAERRSLASAIEEGTNFESTRIKLGWIEQLSPTLQSEISLGHERALYSSPQSTRIRGRKDDYWIGRAEIQWALRPHSSLGLFLESSANHSSPDNEFSFRRNQLGLSLNLHF